MAGKDWYCVRAQWHSGSCDMSQQMTWVTYMAPGCKSRATFCFKAHPVKHCWPYVKLLHHSDPFQVHAALPQLIEQSLPPDPCLDMDIFPKHHPALSSPLQEELLQQSHSSTTGKVQLSFTPTYVIYYIPYNLWVTLYNLIYCRIHCSSSPGGNWKRHTSVLMLLDYHRKSSTATAQRHK